MKLQMLSKWDSLHIIPSNKELIEMKRLPGNKQLSPPQEPPLRPSALRSNHLVRHPKRKDRPKSHVAVRIMCAKGGIIANSTYLAPADVHPMHFSRVNHAYPAVLVVQTEPASRMNISGTHRMPKEPFSK